MVNCLKAGIAFFVISSLVTLPQTVEAAFVVNPGSAGVIHLTGTGWGPGASDNDALAYLNGLLEADLTKLWKSEGEGNIADSWYTWTGQGASSGTIDHVPSAPGYIVASQIAVGATLMSDTWLFLKDQSHGHYLISLFGWNGTDTIEWNDFWPGTSKPPGNASHATIFGLNVGGSDNLTEVPEPASMALWLTVAAGGAFARRRRLQAQA